MVTRVRGSSSLQVDDYAALRALPSAKFQDGDVLTVTNDGIAGPFIVKTGAVTDNAGTLIVPTDDANRYFERVLEFADTYNPIWFGADPTGTTDSQPAIQACLDIRPNVGDSYAPTKIDGGEGRVTVILTEGQYRLDDFLDMSQRDYVTLEGQGRVNLRPNHTGYIIDMTSADNCIVRRLRLDSRDTDDCTIGIYLNRATTAAFAQFNHFEDLEIVMGVQGAANSGLGSIGIFNCRAEQNQFKNVTLRADLPYYARQTHSSLQPQANCTQDTSIASCSVCVYDQCNFIANGPYTYCMRLDGALEHQFNNCYWGKGSSNVGSNVYAALMDGCSSCKIFGSNEGNARFAAIKNINNNNEIRIAQQLAPVDTGGIINMDNAGGNAEFNNGIVSIMVAGGSVPAGACVFKDSGTATTVKIIGNIVKCTSLLNPITFVAGGSRDVNHNIEQTDTLMKFSGAVYKFDAQQITSSDVNTLDDYEEGTFTPAIEGATAPGAATYTIESGVYTKIGDTVFFTLDLAWSGHTGTGNMLVTGMPFTSDDATSIRHVFAISANNIALSASNIISCRMRNNSTTIDIEEMPVGGGARAQLAVDAAGDITITGSYKVA